MRDSPFTIALLGQDGTLSVQARCNDMSFAIDDSWSQWRLKL